MALSSVQERLRAWALAHRPHISMTEGSLVYLLYEYGVRNGRKRLPQENFCHLSRVLMWSALHLFLWKVLLPGPKVKNIRIPVVPMLLLLAALGVTYYLWTHTFMQVLMWTGIILWGLLGLLMTHILGMILKERHQGTYEGFDVEIGSSRTAKAVFIMATVLALPVIVVFSALALVLGPLIYGLLLLALKLFDDWELHLKVQAAYRWFFSLHPLRLSWLTPKWLLLVPIGYLAWRFELVRVGLVGVGALFIVVATTVLTANHINNRYSIPAQERARQDMELRHRLTMENRRMQWSRLAATPEFWAWLWDSDDPFAKGTRKHAIARSATRDETPIMFVRLMGDAEMEMAENLFLLWRLGISNYGWNTEPGLPPRPNALDSIGWVVSIGKGVRWLLSGIAQVAMVFFTALWSAKVVGICPLVEIKPANNRTTAA